MRYLLTYKARKQLSLVGAYCLILLFTVPCLFASTMTTYDSDGVPYNIQDIISNSPETFVQNMKDYLKLGNIDALGALSSELILIKGSDPEVQALHSLFLASKGNLSASKSELEKISQINSNAHALYAKAMILRGEKQYKKALEICKKAVSLDKKHPYPWNIMGRIYFDTSDYKKAIDSFETAVKLVPGFLPGHTNLGAVFFTVEDYQASVKHFKLAVNINPDSDKAHYGLALAYEKLGQYLPAIKALEKTLELNPVNQSALQELGLLYLKTQQYKKALETGNTMKKSGVSGAYEILGNASLYLGNPQQAEEYLKKAPEKNISINYLMGFCLMMLDRHNEALIQMEDILIEQPDHYGAYYARAALKFYLNQKLSIDKDLKTGWGDQLDKAIFFARGCVNASRQNWNTATSDWHLSNGMVQGFSIDGIDEKTLKNGLKKDELPYLNLGLLYYFKNHHDHALLEFKKAVKINNLSILSNYWAGQALLLTGKRKEAEIFFETAIKNAPNFFVALYTIGELSFMAGDSKKAENYYKKALLVKKDPGILVKLGLLNEKSKEFEKAGEYYEELIKYFPELFIGYNQLAWLYTRQGIELNKAMTLAKKADTLQPGNAGILDTIGWIYFQNKNYKTALVKLTKANKTGPANPSILYHLGAVHNELKEYDSAKKYLKEALRISKNFDEAKEAQTLFNKLK